MTKAHTSESVASTVECNGHSGLFALGLAIPDQEQPAFNIQIAPINAADFFETHGRGYYELQYPWHR